jgi:hypothetical protein
VPSELTCDAEQLTTLKYFHNQRTNMGPTFSPLERKIMSEVSSSLLMKHTQEIARYVRISGSEDEAKSLEYVKNILSKYGFKIREYQADAYIGYPEMARLDITQPESRSISGTSNSLAPSTSATGTNARIVYLGSGGENEFSKASVAGKLVLLEGLAEPEIAKRADNNGAAGEIFINDDYAHEGTVSVVWGTPRAETASLLPSTPCITVTSRDGAYIKGLLEKGEVSGNLVTRTWRGWKKIPTVIADIPGKEAAKFTLLSGHIDSWHYGAMDNGTANAAMLEVGRIISRHKNLLRRGLRIAFWSGHSHGRYAGSTWYADNFWLDLEKNCVAHVNVDSLGGKGAGVLTEAPAMSSARDFASSFVEKVAGQKLSGRDLSRAGDQSFVGIGVPSIFMELSEIPIRAEQDDSEAKAVNVLGSSGSGLGWWWHTPEDTVDKIDPENLVRDTQVYALVTLALCTEPILPFDYRKTAEEIKRIFEDLQRTANGSFDFSSLVKQASELLGVLNTFYRKRRKLRGKLQLDAFNNTLIELGHLLIPVTHTSKGRFDHEFALPVPLLPCLRDTARLAVLDKNSDEFRFLYNGLRRDANRVVFALNEATEIVSHVTRSELKPAPKPKRKLRSEAKRV